MLVTTTVAKSEHMDVNDYTKLCVYTYIYIYIYIYIYRPNICVCVTDTEKPKNKDHLEDPDVDGRIILRWLFRKWDWEYGLDRSGSG